MAWLPTRLFVLLLVAMAYGCAAPKPFVAPVDIPLQDAPPGLAIVYFLRSPYDSATVQISMSGKKLAVMPSSTYSAIVLPPGNHAISTGDGSALGQGRPIAPVLVLDLKPDQRLFFNLAGANEKSLEFLGVQPLAGGVVVPLIISTQGTASGTRSWKKVSELDAQGLMSISKVTMPEPGAL